jgi:hypothetical protein
LKNWREREREREMSYEYGGRHIRFRGFNHYIFSRTIPSEIFGMPSVAAVSTSEMILIVFLQNVKKMIDPMPLKSNAVKAGSSTTQ